MIFQTKSQPDDSSRQLRKTCTSTSYYIAGFHREHSGNTSSLTFRALTLTLPSLSATSPIKDDAAFAYPSATLPGASARCTGRRYCCNRSEAVRSTGVAMPTHRPSRYVVSMSEACLDHEGSTEQPADEDHLSRAFV